MVLNIILFSNIFKKKGVIFWENVKKTVSEARVSFEGKEAFGEENEYNFFMGSEFRIFFHLTIFLKKAKFLKKMGKKIFGGHDHFLGEGVILRQKWI